MILTTAHIQREFSATLTMNCDLYHPYRTYTSPFREEASTLDPKRISSHRLRFRKARSRAEIEQVIIRSSFSAHTYYDLNKTSTEISTDNHLPGLIFGLSDIWKCSKVISPEELLLRPPSSLSYIILSLVNTSLPNIDKNASQNTPRAIYNNAQASK